MAAPHLVIVPTWGVGHLTPMAEFAKCLLLRHGITSTFVAGDVSSKSHMALVDRLPHGIDFVSLPDVSLDDLPREAKIETVITMGVIRAMPALRDVIADLKTRTNLLGLVCDLFGGPALELARELGLRPFIFFPSNALLLSLFLRLPDLDARTVGEFRDLPDPVLLPGCVPLLGADLLDPCQDRSNEAYALLLRQASSYPLAEAIFVNSFDAMEGATFMALAGSPGAPPVYAVGPLVQSPDPGPDPGACTATEWLDRHPPGSVLFVSFGSGGTLPLAQLTELALGLEASGQRFLWVVRRPSEERADAAFFSVVDAEDSLGFLPEGFLERTRATGLVLPSWAPQARVLSHAATGGFMTHCGWNSVLESVVNGVPMIAWPLYAEQRMNARLLAERVQVALRATPEENGLVGRDQAARLVQSLMAGEEGTHLRQRVRELQREAASGLADGGASHVALAKVVADWKGCCTATP